MKRLVGILILIVALLSACGGGEASRRMDLADSLMEERPDSSLRILQTIDSSQLSRKSLQARHALLTTQARVKTDLLDLSDTSALPLLDYYRDHGSDFDRMRAAFYRAWVYYLTQDYINAFRTLTVSYDIADYNKNFYWLAKIHELKADIYNLNGIYQEAVESRKKAIEYYREAGRLLNVDYATCDLSMDYKNNDNPGMSLQVLNNLINAEQLDINLRSYLLHHLTAINYRLTNYKAADSCQRLLDSLTGNSYDNFGACKMRAFIAVKLNRRSADSLMMEYRLTLENGSDSALYYNMMRNLASERGDNALSNELADSVIFYQNREVARVLKQSLPREELLIQIGKNEQSKKVNNKLIISLAVLVFCILAIIIFARIRLLEIAKRKDREIRYVKDMLIQYMYEIEDKKCRLDSHPIDQNSQILLIYRDYVRKLLKICHKYDEEQSRKSKSDDHGQIINILKRFGTEKELQSMYETFNTAYDGILDTLKENYGKQFSESRDTIVLLFAGFNPPIIALILDENINTIYTRRKRLLSRLQSLDMPIAKICISVIK